MSASIDNNKKESIDSNMVASIDKSSRVLIIHPRHIKSIDQCQWDGYEPSMEKQETEEGVQSEKRVKSSKVFIPKYLWREVNKVELDGFHKRVKRVPKDMSFEDAYYKYRPGNFFRESRETDKDIEMLFNKVRRLKMEPSQDSFTFVDNSKANSAGMIKNVKVEIGDCSIPVDFHVVKSKSGQISSLLFGRAFMATVGAVCDLKKNRMCLTNVDEIVFYDPVEKKKESNDSQPSESNDSQSSESIDTKLSASVDTLRLSEQPETEKSKSGGRKKNRKKKKKKNTYADSLSVVPLECQEGSLEYRVRCREGSESFTKVKGKDPRKMSLLEDRRWMRIIDRQSIITSIDRSPLNCVDRQSFKSIDRHLTVLVDTRIKVR
ncbi:hypothetical protein F2Q69_00059029 [Brassica cretica]|uniref:Aspartic peptidase DDI1-type domain-containing protein n=1 Tax=Brassica cretica TaxID=69181 RepID=A0A8S9RLP1_BRACR|nr:hypothetical protein F2Q69_00059029 [Brassica cretica]